MKFNQTKKGENKGKHGLIFVTSYEMKLKVEVQNTKIIEEKMKV